MTQHANVTFHETALNPPVAEKTFKVLQKKDMSPKTLSMFPKFNVRAEELQKEEVHKQLVRGEMKIHKSNSQKRLIAALIQPQMPQPKTVETAAVSPKVAVKKKQFKVKSFDTPIVDRLDPQINFNSQLRRAGKNLDVEDNAAFKNCQDSLTQAKKEKVIAGRIAQKQQAAQAQAEEAAMLAFAKGLQKKFSHSSKMTASRRRAMQKAAQPQIDQSTYSGKMQILKDVRANKYPLPKNFPTLEEIQETKNKTESSHYQKTAQRRIQIDAKRTRVQDKFVQDQMTNLSTFRRTTRDYHVEKEHYKLLHGAPIGRYSPSYERVWSKAPTIEIAGVKDRFGYDNKNSPLFVKVAEGQNSAAATPLYTTIGSPKTSGQAITATVNNQTLLEFGSPSKSRNQRSKTMVQFRNGSKLSNSSSVQKIDSAVIETKSIGAHLKTQLDKKQSTTTHGSEQIKGDNRNGGQSLDGNAVIRKKSTVTTAGMVSKTTRSISESPSIHKLRGQRASTQSFAMTESKRFLPTLDDIKYNSSFLCAQNPKKMVKGVDFMGYAKRKEIYDGRPEPVESRFELPNNVCPLVSTKHKYTAKVDIGKYSKREFFTDKIRDWPFK